MNSRPLQQVSNSAAHFAAEGVRKAFFQLKSPHGDMPVNHTALPNGGARTLRGSELVTVTVLRGAVRKKKIIIKEKKKENLPIGLFTAMKWEK